jgi:hypothetical protein
MFVMPYRYYNTLEKLETKVLELEEEAKDPENQYDGALPQNAKEDLVFELRLELEILIGNCGTSGRLIRRP